MNELELRQTVKDSGVNLLEKRLVQGTWGNSSVRLGTDKMIVTPSGMDYVRLTPEDMPIVDINTLEWEGKFKPTSERKIHAAIYRERPEINAVIHSHPTYCSILASVREELPVSDPVLAALTGGNVRVGGYGLPGTKTLTKATIAAMSERNACLMANHGVLCAGKTMDEAFRMIELLEAECKKFIEKKTLELTGAKTFTQELLFRYFVERHAK